MSLSFPVSGRDPGRRRGDGPGGGPDFPPDHSSRSRCAETAHGDRSSAWRPTARILRHASLAARRRGSRLRHGLLLTDTVRATVGPRNLEFQQPAYVSGFPGLDEAMRKAVPDMVGLLAARSGLDHDRAWMLLSLAADLRITQVVNGEKGVHMMIRNEWIATPNG